MRWATRSSAVPSLILFIVAIGTFNVMTACTSTAENPIAVDGLMAITGGAPDSELDPIQLGGPNDEGFRFVPGCTSLARDSEWLVYPGGFWLKSPA